ncbi:MAG: PAS domain S-box protein [Candidatus Bathyarchaeota archaeon]|nr:PAS domain S-box protein [Candidatus Bathyarchaeota archaeon]
MDDEEYQLETVKTFMGQLDSSLQIEAVSTAQEALQRLDEKNFDCVVTDFKIPGISGLDLSRKIREKSSIPIILYTGQGSEEVAEKAFAIGIDDYIRKEIEPSHYQLLSKRIRDVVEKKRMENLYLSVVEDTRDALSISVGTTLVYANQALADLVGVKSPLELIGKDATQWIAPEMRLQAKVLSLKRAKNDIVSRSHEYDLLRGDGRRIRVETSASFIDFNGGKATLSFTRDITERKEMDEARRKSEEKFRSLVNLAPDGIITLNMRGVITFVNPSFLKLTGYSKEEIIGKSFLNVSTLRPTDMASNLKLFTNILRGQPMQPIEFQWVRKGGSTCWGEAHLSVIKISGEKRELIGVVRDITERRRLMEELQSYSKELEDLVQERTQMLLDSEKMIAAARVSSMVGHDLRGPLNTVKNAVYIMQTQPDKSAEMMRLINSAVDTSAHLLDELRGMTKETPFKFEDIDITNLIKSVIYETPLPPTVKVETDLKGKCVLKVDRIKMRRVLDNLLRNAVDAMPRGGELYLSTRMDGDDVFIQVRDTGVGIPESMMKNLFKPFVTTKDSGTGLGLNFCRRTVEAHGGEITVKSRVGKGSVFTIHLKKPVAESQASLRESTEEPLEAVPVSRDSDSL